MKINGKKLLGGAVFGLAMAAAGSGWAASRPVYGPNYYAMRQACVNAGISAEAIANDHSAGMAKEDTQREVLSRLQASQVPNFQGSTINPKAQALALVNQVLEAILA
jgi:hypothetical protein